jgi:2-polyprenyl-3-methyl-5-hydroxy-6-metoxy-1,4-benzoquinol methylase
MKAGEFVKANRRAAQLHPDAAAVEEARIRAAYSERKEDRAYARRYSSFNPGQLLMIQERERGLLAQLRYHGCTDLKSKNLLEIGCGSGYWLREFSKWGAQPRNVVGIDLLEDRVGEARRLCPSAVNIECGSAANRNLSMKVSIWSSRRGLCQFWVHL